LLFLSNKNQLETKKILSFSFVCYASKKLFAYTQLKNQRSKNTFRLKELIFAASCQVRLIKINNMIYLALIRRRRRRRRRCARCCWLALPHVTDGGSG
jgi:hypothetical protein